MKIFIVQDHLRCGGTERQSVHLAHHLMAEDNQVSLLTFRPGGPLSDEAAKVGLTHRALQPFDVGLNFFAPGLFNAIHRGQPDVVLCMGRMANCYAGLLQRHFPQIAVVGTVRTGKSLPKLYLWSLRQVSGVLTNTVWWRDQLIAQGVAPGKIAVVANGMTFPWSGEASSAVRAEMRKRNQLSPSSVAFLNVAGFRQGKCQAQLIELFSTLDPNWDCQLWLVGEGRRWQHCRQLAARLGDRRIRLLGHSPDPLPWYAAADVAVSASLEDALPNFLIEAQTTGLPVVARDYQGVGEGLRHGETGYLVSAHDQAAFRAALCELYLEPDLRQRMGQQAAAFARQHHAGGLQAAKALDAIKDFWSHHGQLRNRFA